MSRVFERLQFYVAVNIFSKTLDNDSLVDVFSITIVIY